MRSNQKRIEDGIVEDCLEFMKIYDLDELPDGAWQAMLMDGVKAFNANEGTMLDPFDMFLEYVEKMVHPSKKYLQPFFGDV